MVPTIAQQLRGVRAAIAKALVPALPADDVFAQEQAGIVLATLDWALDVQEAETLYEATERAEYRELLAALAALPSVPVTEAHVVAATPDALADLLAIRAETQALKRAADARFSVVAADGSAEDRTAARELLAAAARRQGAREQAWFRMTGFPTGAPGDVRSALTGAATPAAGDPA